MCARPDSGMSVRWSRSRVACAAGQRIKQKGCPTASRYTRNPPFFRWLMIVHPCPQGEDLGLGGVDIADAEVEVELLGVLAARPGRHHPVVDPLEGKCGSSVRVVRCHAASRRTERGEVLVSAVLNRPAQETRVELRECQGIGGVEDDQVQLGIEVHAARLDVTPDEARPEVRGFASRHERIRTERIGFDGVRSEQPLRSRMPVPSAWSRARSAASAWALGLSVPHLV